MNTEYLEHLLEQSETQKVTVRNLLHKHFDDRAAYHHFTNHWWENHGQEKPVGLDMIQRCIQTLRKHLKDKTPLSDTVKSRIEKLEAFVKVVASFEEKLELGVDSFQELISYRMQFHCKVPDERPRLGQAIMTLLPNNKCVMKNIKQNGRADFKGTFRRSRNDFTDFQMTAPNGEHLYIKTYSFAGYLEDSITMGIYLTQEHSQIVSGVVIIRPNDDRTEAEASVFTPDDGPVWDSIPVEIREFLSYRNINYLSLPNHLNTVKGLDKYLKSKGAVRDKADRSFQVNSFPRVFIATNKKFWDQQQDVLKNTIEYLINDLGIPKSAISVNHTDENTKYDQEKSLRLIRQSEVFIGFMSKSDMQSFSGVELGWGIIYCSSVIMFNEECSSRGITNYKEVQSMNFKNFDAKDANQKTKICDFIHDHYKG